jgi:hypothetical protein
MGPQRPGLPMLAKAPTVTGSDQANRRIGILGCEALQVTLENVTGNGYPTSRVVTCNAFQG